MTEKAPAGRRFLPEDPFTALHERAAEVEALPGGEPFCAFANACFEVVPQPGDVAADIMVEDWHFLGAVLFVGHLLDDFKAIPRKLRVELIARVAHAQAMACAQERARRFNPWRARGLAERSEASRAIHTIDYTFKFRSGIDRRKSASAEEPYRRLAHRRYADRNTPAPPDIMIAANNEKK